MQKDWSKIEKLLKSGKLKSADELLDKMLDVKETEIDPELDEQWENLNKNKE